MLCIKKKIKTQTKKNPNYSILPQQEISLYSFVHNKAELLKTSENK